LIYQINPACNANDHNLSSCLYIIHPIPFPLAESVPFCTPKHLRRRIFALFQLPLPLGHWLMSRWSRIIHCTGAHFVADLLLNPISIFKLAQLCLFRLLVLVCVYSCLFIVGEGGFGHDVCACAGCGNSVVS
jgi:hypothetical protein